MHAVMLWLKAFHIIFMVAWFAGLFYLPRLFVYHARSSDSISLDRFKLMERKLFFGIMTPSALLTVLFGAATVIANGWELYARAGWLHAKLGLVAILIAYHIHLGKLLHNFRHDRNRHTHVYYRWINELPVLILTGVVILAVVKPI